jgi:hypothetical protein
MDRALRFAPVSVWFALYTLYRLEHQRLHEGATVPALLASSLVLICDRKFLDARLSAQRQE